MDITKSLQLQEHAKERIPGLTQLLSKRPDRFSYGVWPGYYKKAQGVEVWDVDDNCYVDMSIGGIGANVLGYADPDVNAAVMDAVNRGSSCSLNCPEEVELADLLCELHPWAQKVRFARTGGEAMTIAVRIARAHTGKDKVAFCGYHGWHDWYLAANVGTENALGEHLISGLEPAGVPKVLAGTALPFHYNQLEGLRKIVSENPNEIGVIVLESIRDEPPTRGFIEGVRAIADETGAVLVFDEISAGFRMNTGGAHLLYGMQPDMAVFSKALGNGFPIAAIIGKDSVMDSAQKTFISSTYWTDNIGPAAALAMIKKHRTLNVGDHLMAIGNMVQKGWKELAEKNQLDISVGGIPPLSHFSFKSNPQVAKALFIQWMLERGFLTSTSFYAMFAHQKEHVQAYLKAADETFARIKDAADKQQMESELQGMPAAVGFKRLT
jgi:glutamate-1-semialdehyde 2,1-aminomutase